MILLEFHGQSSLEAIALVFASPMQIAPKFHFGHNCAIYGSEAYRQTKAPEADQNTWRGRGVLQNVRSCIISTNVAETGITIPDVGEGHQLRSATTCLYGCQGSECQCFTDT